MRVELSPLPFFGTGTRTSADSLFRAQHTYTGASYPAGWLVMLPGERLHTQLQPAVADQELDTRPSTGVVYWEGSQVVAASRAGTPLGGQAYVELTGYGP